MLGDSLLVAPVFSHNGSVTYYVPEGRWTSLLSGKQVEGPGWKREEHDFMSLPLLVRPNSVIPVGNRVDRPDYDYSDDVTLHIYQVEDGRHIRVEIPSTNGNIETTFEVKRKGNDIQTHRRGSQKKWKVVLHHLDVVKSFEMDEAANEASLQIE